MATDIIEQITDYTKQKRNFLLSGGAGSGKTYTLIQTLHSLYAEDSKARVACITYTNVAADQIKKRSPYSQLWVSTIHDFLWENIKKFQQNLVTTIYELLSNNELSYSGDIPIEQFTFSTIEYKNYRKLDAGTISHDDLLKVAEFMFKNYPLLSRILCDKFDYILIDEYQDTHSEVRNIFLEYIKPHAIGKLCLGFFGDRMQSIYDSGIVDIQQYVHNGQIAEIVKTDNYRCSQSVIQLLNKIRNDLSQSPSKKNPDGTIANKQGSITFLYSDRDFDLSIFEKTRFATNWDFSDPSKTKLLFLTHKLIAKRSGWEGILSAYKHNDMLLGNEPDILARHLLKIGEIISAYQDKKYSLVIVSISRKIHTNKDKREISAILKDTCENLTITIGDVLNNFKEKNILTIDDKLNEYITNNQDIYNNIKTLPISEVKDYYTYYNKFSPYSTQHGIKGDEFDNVLVIMDNGNWNKYNFGYYFEERNDKNSIVDRTKRIFYVCCSRAIDNLVVYYPSPSEKILSKANLLFGETNVIQLKE